MKRTKKECKDKKQNKVQEKNVDIGEEEELSKDIEPRHSNISPGVLQGTLCITRTHTWDALYT